MYFLPVMEMHAFKELVSLKETTQSLIKLHTAPVTKNSNQTSGHEMFLAFMLELQ